MQHPYLPPASPCLAPVLTDLGPEGSYVDVFKTTYDRAILAGGYIIGCNHQVDYFYVNTILSCPANSTGTPTTNPTTCTCNSNYQPDPTATSCVPNTCPVDPLPQPPFPASDTCSNSLEQGRGTDVNNACAAGLTPDMQAGVQCVADKIHALAIPYSGPSATVRTTAYQEHLLAVWNKSKEIKMKVTNANKQACATVIADVNNEMAWHGIDSPPSRKGNQAPHVLGRAIDVPTNTANALIAQVTTATTVSMPGCLSCYTPTITLDVEDYVNSSTVNPPACNLRWGGRFTPYDPVHFQLP